jgi:DNA-directed RNA polymerase alpha subunit
MTLLLILGTLTLIITGLFYMGRGNSTNELEENIKKYEEKVEIPNQKLNIRTLSLRAQKCIRGMHINYVHDLDSITKDHILSQKGVGKSTLTEIEDWSILNYNHKIK